MMDEQTRAVIEFFVGLGALAFILASAWLDQISETRYWRERAYHYMDLYHAKITEPPR